MASFTDDLSDALLKKKVWIWWYSKGEDGFFFYYKTAEEMIVGCMNHSSLNNISPQEVTFGKVMMYNGEPRIARISSDMIRVSQMSVRAKN